MLLTWTSTQSSWTCQDRLDLSLPWLLPIPVPGKSEWVSQRIYCLRKVFKRKGLRPDFSGAGLVDVEKPGWWPGF